MDTAGLASTVPAAPAFSGARVLVIDDSPDIGQIVCRQLAAEGYAATLAATGEEALRCAGEQRPDVILLDLTLPDGDGLALIAPLRRLARAPIIIVSARGDWVDRVVGLEMGADDYLAKPFELRELVARIRAGLRRCGAPAAAPDAPARLRLGHLLLDPAQYECFFADGGACGLTAMEFRLLAALAAAPGCVLTRDQLLSRARTDSLEVFDRAIDIQVMRLRRKICDDPAAPRVIRTVRGVGYALACAVERLPAVNMATAPTGG